MEHMVINDFQKGIKDGIPIGLGYLSVSFTFGMMAVSSGVPLYIAVLISLTNLTSAGQFAGLELILASGSYVEMALTQLIINLRYALMSLSLSQKVERTMSTRDRCMIAYGVTDEIFAMASSQTGHIGKKYMWGLIVLPVFCWTFGTFIGGAASTLLPQAIRDAMGIAIYGMFLAIIIPPAKKFSSVRKVVIFSALLSCTCSLLHSMLPISSGFVIILCTIIAAGAGAYLFPVEEA